MKKINLLLFFLGAVVLGQTYEFTGAGSNAAWNNPANWDGGVVPLMNGYHEGSITIPAGKTAVISADDVLNWAEGLIYGPGSVINNGEFNLNYGNNMYFTSNLKFTNKGVFNVGNLNTTAIINFIFSQPDTELINDTSGVINLFRKDIQGYGGSGGTITNNGVINKTGNFPVTIAVSQFINNNHINVEENELTLEYTTRLNDGIYDVAEDAVLRFVGTNYLEGTLQGNVEGEFKLGSGIQGDFFVEAGKTLVNQLSGKGITHVSGLFKGPGNFINESVYTVGFDDNTYLANGLKFTNKGVFNVGDLTSSSSLNFIFSGADTEFINDTSGTLNLFRKDIQGYGGSAGIITNNGVINKTGNFPVSIAVAQFINNNHINVEENELTLKYTTRLNDGIYDISEDAVLCFEGNNYFEGTLLGNVQGKFKLGSGSQENFTVEEGKTAVNKLSGKGITQVSGLFYGPGNFINESIYTIGFENNTYLAGGLKFTNKEIFNVGSPNTTSTSSFNFSSADTELINDTTGILNLFRKDMQGYNGAAGIITNKGLINKESNFSSEIETVLNNETGGKISVKDGSLYLSGMTHNKEGGLMEGVNLKFKDANHLTNSGTVNPGIGVGQMTIETFFGMENGILVFELQGLTPISEYDFIEYTGTKNIDLNGSINVLLSFEPQINDSFTVFHATNANITAQLGEFAYGKYEGYDYKFSVVSTNDEVILTMISKTLDIMEETITQLQVYPNPVTAVLNLKNDKPIDLIEVFNTQGQSIMKKEINEKQGQLDFSRLPAGIYMLKIHTGNEVIMKKAIKK